MLVLLSWSESFSRSPRPSPPPSSQLVSPPLSPPSLSRRARWHCTDRRWHFDAPLCPPSSPPVRPSSTALSAGSAARSAPLSFFRFLRAARGRVLGCLCAFVGLWPGWSREISDFWNATLEQKGQAEERRTSEISTSPSPCKHPLSLSLFQSFSCTAVTFSPSCPVGSALRRRVSDWRAAGAEPLPSPGFNTLDQWTAPRQRPSALQTRRRRWVTAPSRAPSQPNKVNWI